ncbi:MAG: helix-turn-helix transcriptional regulator [Nevskia sp.]|nr:helix-turn-helix transcriptional regulator [Nevskia sp.]
MASKQQKKNGEESSNAAHGVTLPLDQFSRLVALVYRGALDPLPWSGAVEALHRLLQASWVTLILRPASAGHQALMINMGLEGGPHVAASPHINPDVFTLDPFMNLPSDRIVTADEMVGESNWLNSEYYRQFCEPAGVRYVMGADIHTEEGSECRFRICRPPEAQPFSAADKALCQMLLPHFENAVRFYTSIDAAESERQLLAGTVDRMLLGTVILDEAGTVLKTNSVAHHILRENDGLRIAQGLLEAGYGAENRELYRLIKLALQGITSTAGAVSQAMSISRPSGRAKLGLALRSIPQGEWLETRHRPTVAVFIRDPESRSQATREMIQRLFGLTPAESSLALLLADGQSLDEAAVQLGVRKNTARAQLRAIFSKTGVTRQTALVRLLLASVTPQ